MKIIQTLSTLGKNTNLYERSSGWYAPEYHLMSWALSCMQLKAYYPEVILYADSHAARVLMHDLQLPYSEVKIIFDQVNLPHPDLWALPKLETYACQLEPFLHVDGDVFLFAPLPEQLLSNKLIAQNRELGTAYYTSMQQQLLELQFTLPECVQADFTSADSIQAVNAGILGGTDIDFFHEYTYLAGNYISENVHRFSSIDVNKFNVFFEQHLFYALAKAKGLEINYLFEEYFEDNKYKGLGNFWEVPHTKNYLHLIGGYKRNQYYCAQMAFKLRELYPDIYYRIIKLFRNKGIKLKLNYYSAIQADTMDSFRHYSQKGITDYSTGAIRTNLKNAVNINENELYKKMKAYASKFISDKDFVCRNENSEVISRTELAHDFESFSGNLKELLHKFSAFSGTYLYGRDLQWSCWYSKAFINTFDPGVKLVKCDEVDIIETKFDWSICFESVVADEAVSKSEELTFKQEKYYSLVVAEAYEGGFSLNEVDDFQLLLLDRLNKPHSIPELIDYSKQYFEEDVVENNMEEIEQFILMLLKQLLLIKAIKPVQ